MEKFRIGLLTSAWDEVAWDLVEEVYRNVQNGLIPNSEIVFVFVSRDEGETRFGDLMIRNVRAARLPLITFSSLRFKPELREKDREVWRLEHDREVMKLLPPTDLIVLLGYMWWFSKEMCQKRTAINLHPAAPGGPAGSWQEVVWQLIDSQAKETGVTMHLVTPELDKGPVVTYCTFSIRGKPFDRCWKKIEGCSLTEIKRREGENNSLFKIIRQHGLVREFPLIVATLKAFSGGWIRIDEGLAGYDLTAEIDAIVKEKTRKGGKTQ